MTWRGLSLALALLVATPLSAAESNSANPFASPPLFYELRGEATQGGLLIGRAAPNSDVMLDGKPVPVTPDGAFVIGFGRDHGLTAQLEVSINRGPRERRTLVVMPRMFDIQRITGVAEKYVSPSPEDMKRIEEERRLIRQARERLTMASDFVGGFIWPVAGPISGVYGSQRVLNGQPRQPHFGVDVAASTGTPLKAPAGGVVSLADPDLFFTGGTVMLDHGYGLTSIFAHQSRIDVKEGDKLAKGDVFGLLGGTGRVTGPHLHWGIYLGTIPLDPQLLVPPMPS